MRKPVILIVLDGWGIAPSSPGNAVTQASLPNFNKFWVSFPHAKLLASGESVGLPKGERGNSETGHMNLGAGRVVYQDLPRINMSVADGSFFKNNAFAQAFDHVKKNNSNLHLMGLIGEGGVHSNNEHLFALLHLAKEAGIKNVFLHLFTDGRDSPPTSAPLFLYLVEDKLKKEGVGKIATISGRYFALDRDNRWERTQKTYEAMVENKGLRAYSTQEAVQSAYSNGKTDEFIEPTIIVDQNNLPIAQIKDNDAVIFYNYRIDRPRQLSKAFILEDLDSAVKTKPYFDPYTEKYFKKTYVELPKSTKTFPRKTFLKNLVFVTMTEYEKDIPAVVAFPPIVVENTLSKVLSNQNLRQLHVSETEKERFVTYYFNGENEKASTGEEWSIIPSPKVATYDLQPSMSAAEVTDLVLRRLSEQVFDFILVNFANPDMVGHTGVIPAGISACEAVDSCLGKIVTAAYSLGGTCIITADHGNVEEMINPVTGGVDTEHSTNPVPFIIVNQGFEGDSKTLQSGILADVAPTILKIMDINKPSDFSGRSLI